MLVTFKDVQAARYDPFKPLGSFSVGYVVFELKELVASKPNGYRTSFPTNPSPALLARGFLNNVECCTAKML